MLPIVVSRCRLKDGRIIRVVRDDLLPAGTKQRALLEWMPKQKNKHFVFGSAPATGYAQVALAYVCRELGPEYSIKLFMAKRKVLHERTERALEYGADITFLDFGMLSNTEAHAKRYAAETGAFLFPIGLEAPGVLETIAKQARTIKPAPTEFWTVVGGGTLNRALQLAWPDAAANAIQVGHKANVGRATLWEAPERYDQKAQIMPPFPSVPEIDAKAWRFIREHASDGALFWNVGK